MAQLPLARRYRHRGRNKSASPAMRFDITEGFELVVGFFDRERRNDELFAELAMGSELLATLQAAAGDGLGDLPHDLAVERKIVGRVYYKLHL